MFDSDFFSAAANRKILVVGDVMLDKFYFADGNLTWLKEFDDNLSVEFSL